MSTTRQKRVAKLKIENLTREKPLTDIEILKSSNYSISTSETKSTKIMNSEGVQEELIASGFTTENAKNVVDQILNNEKVEPNTRLNAAKEVFKVNGDYAPDKSINVNINAKSIDPTDPKVLEALKTINERLENE